MLAIERSVFHLLLRREYCERMRSCQPYLDGLYGLDFDGQLDRRDPLHQSLYIWNKTMLPNYVLVAERLEMAFGVETRPPFLDHLLFDSIRQLPLSALVSERQGKQALRIAARKILPASVIAQRKHPFAAPLGLSEPGSALFKRVDEVFRSGILDTMPFFDTQAVLTLWTQLPELPVLRRAALEPILLMIFCACVLHQRYISN
jgi:asparagine synthase (glutamine-hydrolysing)